MFKSENKLLFFIILAALSITSILVFQSIKLSSQEENNSPNWPSKHELRRAFWRSGKMLIIYATGTLAATSTFENYAHAYAGAISWLNVTVKPDTLTTSKDLTATPVTLIGAQFRNESIIELISGLPVPQSGKTFHFGEKFTFNPGDVFVLSLYPNPLAPQLPVTFIGADNDNLVQEFLPNISSHFARAGEFRVFRDGTGVLLGFFKQKGHSPWQVASEQSRVYLHQAFNQVETANYRIIYHGDKSAQPNLNRIAKQQERLLQKMTTRLTNNLPEITMLPKITLNLYQSAEDKGLMTGSTDLAHADIRHWAVHAIYNKTLRGTDFFADAQLILNKLLGSSASGVARDGLAMVFTKDWLKYGFEYWSKRYQQTGNVIPLDDLVNARIYTKESYLFKRPLAGSFVDFLLKKYGMEKFLQLYRLWPAQGLPKTKLPEFTRPALEKGWKSYLAGLKINEPGLVLSNNKSTSSPVFQKGFSYAHEGYQIYNGYLSRKSQTSLTKLRTLGTEWISITPFGYLEHKNQPGYVHYALGAGSENDESLVTALMHARQLGMNAMLKPHVLMNNHNFGWPGEVEMKNEADWQVFFKYYRSWILHYAVLAEVYGFDIFCIGTELMHTTTKDHQEKWRKIIGDIRRLYHGQLVYAANWWQEFQQIDFWDELDYIGLNCYYPLSQSEHATSDDLKQGVQQFIPMLAKVANKYGKPVLLTEIGFTSTNQSWKQPHKDGRGKSPFLNDQVKCYRAVFESLWDKPWFYGFYWWKWPTYLENGGLHSSSFTPNGKPAEKVVAEWYAKQWLRN